MTQLDKRFIGSISEATMRTEDLLPKFISVLEAADPKHQVVEDYRELEKAVETLADWAGMQPAEYAESIGLWEMERVSMFLNDSVFDALNDVAPEGTYFSSSEGDGASYGFWYMDCDVCGKSLGDHSPEGQGCDDPDMGDDAEIEVVS